MKIHRSIYSKAAAAALAMAALGMSAAARAGDVFWSIGLASPGVSVGVANAAPVYVAPQPVYVQPQPVYVAPQPVYVQPRPIYYNQPVVVRPAPVYQAGWVQPGYGHRWHKKHGHHGHHRGWDRDDD